jgi:hypothetical protein
MNERGIPNRRRVISRTGRANRDLVRDLVRRDMPTVVVGRTLGEALVLAMSERGDTHHDAAVSMGTARANVYLWTDDLIDPWPENFDALTEYLGVEIDTLGGFIIHSQMRRAQLRNRGA